MKQSPARKTANMVLGLLILTFTVIGIIATVRFAGGKMRDITGDTARLQEYQKFLSPVVMNDPDTFDDITGADQSQLISIAIWEILQNDPNPDDYGYFEGDMLLPQSEVEESFAALFGTELTVHHKDVDGGGIGFRYSESEKGYLIPITGVTPIYTPRIISAEEKRDLVTLIVGYLAGEDFQQDSDGNIVAPEPAKYMKITLRTAPDGSYFVSALQNAQQPD
ncbi:MAG: hypothetical protein IJU56_04660 [Clostridia bacterium]|nr:hypothetical protein [Clostridia bacterium]